MYDIIRIRDTWTKQEVKQLLQKELDNWDLYLIIVLIYDSEIKKLAWSKLRKQEPNYYEVDFIIRMHPSLEIREVVAEHLLEQGVDSNFLYLPVIIEYVPQMREQAWEQLQKKEISNTALHSIVEHVPEMGERIAKQFLKGKPSDLDLVYVIEYVPQMREQAWRKLLKQGADSNALLLIIVDVPEMRERVAKQLLKQGADSNALHFIIEYVPEMREYAEEQLRALC